MKAPQSGIVYYGLVTPSPPATFPLESAQCPLVAFSAACQNSRRSLPQSSSSPSGSERAGAIRCSFAGHFKLISHSKINRQATGLAPRPRSRLWPLDSAVLCLRPAPASLLSLPPAPNQLEVVEVGPEGGGRRWGVEEEGERLKV